MPRTQAIHTLACAMRMAFAPIPCACGAQQAVTALIADVEMAFEVTVPSDDIDWEVLL